MKRSNENTQEYDDLLADFADRALSYEVENIESNLDEDLRDLQKMVLRLKHSLPNDPVEQATLKRMKNDFLIKSRSSSMRKQETPLMAFLNRMMQIEINPNIILTVGSMAVFIGVLVVAAFTTNTSSGTLIGTAGSGAQITGISIGAGIIFLLLMLWISRRK